MQRGGSLDFSILLEPDTSLDNKYLVIGRVVDGMDVVSRIAKVPTNQRTVRDVYRSVARAIGDPRARVDVSLFLFLFCFFFSHMLSSLSVRLASCSVLRLVPQLEDKVSRFILTSHIPHISHDHLVHFVYPKPLQKIQIVNCGLL